jgi:hypothetical protein
MFESEFILGWFVRHTLRPLMCFAAGGQVVDTGGAGGDGGAGGGDEGGGGDGAADADADADATDADADADADDATDADEDVDADADADEDADAAARDGRKMPDRIKKALAKLAETDKEAATVARKAYYEAGDYKQVFPNVQAARDAADLIENFGGAEGIGALKKDSTDYEAELAAMAKGDSGAVDRLATDFPQGLVKMAPYALAKLKDIDPGVYEHTAANVVTESLANYGVAHSLVRLGELIGDGKQKEAAELSAQMLKWVRDTAEFAKSKATPKAGAPAADTGVSKERQEFEAQKAEDFRQRTATASIQTLDRLLTKELNRLLSTRPGLKLTEPQRKSFIHEARGIVAEGLGGISGYKDRVGALLKGGDIDALLRFMRGKALARVNGSHLIAKAARQTWGTRGWAAGGKKKTAGAGGGGGGQGGGVTTLQGKPSADDIDWSKDRGRVRFMNGEATLKNGKVVRWKW